MIPFTFQDKTFFSLDSASTPMHISMVIFFDYPVTENEQEKEVAFSKFLTTLKEKFKTFPIFHTVAVRKGLLNKLYWKQVEDLDFNNHIHIHSSSFINRKDLFKCAGQLTGERLDLSKPLWHCTFFKNVECNQMALYMKVHHSLMDGMRAMSTISSFFKDNELTDSVSIEIKKESTLEKPQKQKHKANLKTKPVAKFISQYSILFRIISNTLFHLPSKYPKWYRAKNTPLNGVNTSARSFQGIRFEKKTIKQMSQVFGATNHEMILAIISGALRKYFTKHNVDSSCYANVPAGISVNKGMGNAFCHMIFSLFTEEKDSKVRLEKIIQNSKSAKSSLENYPKDVLLGVQKKLFLPHLLTLKSGIKTPFSLPWNLTISSVRGPSNSCVSEGFRVSEFYPTTILPSPMGMYFVSMSYDQVICTGIISGDNIISKPELITQYIKDELEVYRKMALESAGT